MLALLLAVLLAGCTAPARPTTTSGPKAVTLASPTALVAEPTGTALPAVRSTPVRRVVVSPPTETPLPMPSPSPSPTSRPTSTAAPTLEAVGQPERLRIPRIGVDAPIVELGLTAAGAVEEPPGPDVVGWYRYGPRPGEPGNSFVTGHLDWKDRTAVFWRLRELRAGDQVQVQSSNGRTHAFVVEEGASYRLADLRVDSVMGYAVGTVLTLFTCDGAFDQRTRDYDRRIVVRARKG
jgi:sortase (surface protein transpeptidase)